MGDVCPTEYKTNLDAAAVAGHPGGDLTCPSDSHCVFGSTDGAGYVHYCMNGSYAAGFQTGLCPPLEAGVDKEGNAGAANARNCDDCLCRNVDGKDLCFDSSAICSSSYEGVIPQADVVEIPDSDLACPNGSSCVFGTTDGTGYIYYCVKA
ncbi:unnamed protein product, partial [Mesorhabditis spiculigera]